MVRGTPTDCNSRLSQAVLLRVMLWPMTRTVLLVCVVFAACSGPSQRGPVGAGQPAPAPGAPPPITPAVASTQTLAPLLVEDGPGFSFADPDRRKKLEAAFPAIEKLIEDERKKQNLPGLAFGIVIDGDLAYAKGFGAIGMDNKAVPDADTVYRIGSISKSFTALALVAVRDEGLVRLDDPLAAWVPEAGKLVYPSRDSQPLTLRQLANHTSGLPRMGTFDPESDASEDVIVKSLDKLALEAAPGTRWSYSNLGFGLLGIAISHAAKTPLHDLIASRITKPLGMTATVWDYTQVPAGKLAPAYQPGPTGPAPRTPSRIGAIDGAGGIYSSVRDMAKYVAFQLGAYPPRSADDTGPIRRASLREAHGTGVQVDLRQQPTVAAVSYGFGWTQERSCKFDDLVGHGGAIDSYRSYIMFSPSRGVGMIALSNFGTADTQAFVDHAFAELDKTGALVPRAAQPSPLLVEAMKRLLAVYHEWDEAGLKAILGRPINPEEQRELATYKQLHGTCREVTAKRTESALAGAFALTCERGTFEMQVATNPRGQIMGFFGFSRGVTPPPAFAKTAKAVLALHNKWSDKIYAKHLAKGAPAAQVKAQAAQFHARHGDCKLGPAIHEGFDWGYQLTCAKENVEAYLVTTPDDLTQVTAIRLRPVRDEPKKCD